MADKEKLRELLQGKRWEEVFAEHIIHGGWCIMHENGQVIRYKNFDTFTWRCSAYGSLSRNLCVHDKEELIAFLAELNPKTENEFGEITP